MKRRLDPRKLTRDQKFAAAVVRELSVRIVKCAAPKSLPDGMPTVMAAVENAGFTQLGWLKVHLLLPFTVAAFSNADGSIYLSAVSNGILGTQAVDLVSQLDRDRKLTTTNFKLAVSQPKLGVFKYSHPNTSIAGLLKKHQSYQRKLGGETIRRERTLDDFKKAIHEQLQQEKGKAKPTRPSLIEPH